MTIQRTSASISQKKKDRKILITSALLLMVLYKVGSPNRLPMSWSSASERLPKARRFIFAKRCPFPVQIITAASVASSNRKANERGEAVCSG